MLADPSRVDAWSPVVGHRSSRAAAASTREVCMSTTDHELVLAHLIVSDDVERSRRF